MRKKNKKSSDIAVIGIGCWYPGAKNPRLFWENILMRRKQFRKIPDKRLPLSEYYDPDPTAEDKTYGTRAAVIDGFHFDYEGKGFPYTTFETTDIAHWLALEVALQALSDSGYDRDNIHKNCGVILGNTLTGEFTRSNSMRTRWPYVYRTLRAAAQHQGLSQEQTENLAQVMERYYKSVFPPVTEDTLAGGLSNTIAGRICNYLDIHGGGFTVDGACASSLLAVATAANALVDGEIDLALAGGVDISLDNFELIGFSKTGALTSGEMSVYGRDASGFIPGEGCGFVVLKRLEDADADNDYIYAKLCGWGVSSDGGGVGLTAPSSEGQSLALQRAYARADYNLSDIDFIEGHGTGTPRGDETELRGIATTLEMGGNGLTRKCGVTSLKSIIGHTKAAAGIGGFIKAVMAVNRRVVPPTADCKNPHAIFENEAKCLYPILEGEVRSHEDTLRAGIFVMGFGGINCHATITSGDAPSNKLASTLSERSILVSEQDSEIFVWEADSYSALQTEIATAIRYVEGMCDGELMDYSHHLVEDLKGELPIRAVVVAGLVDELRQNLSKLEKAITDVAPNSGKMFVSKENDVWLSNQVRKQRVGFLFPGQGSQKVNMARALVERFSWAQEIVRYVDNHVMGLSEFMFRPMARVVDQQEVREWSLQLAQTEVAQPAICLSSLLWVKFLDTCKILPDLSGGHSLGELTAFYMAGAFDDMELLSFAYSRGQAMLSTNDSNGAMASLRCSHEQAQNIISQISGYAILANINSPVQMVVSGEEASVNEIVAIASANGISASILNVSNAFHSRLVLKASDSLYEKLPPGDFNQPSIPVYSSINGEKVDVVNLQEHFSRQVTSQVNFMSLVNNMADHCDLFLEVGPGRVLSNLVTEILPDGPICYPIESQPDCYRDLNVALAALFSNGVGINWQAVFEGRLIRPFIPPVEREYIENPCERSFPDDLYIDKASTQNVTTALDKELLNGGFSAQELNGYLSQRRNFIMDMIRVDMRNLPQVSHSVKKEKSDDKDIVLMEKEPSDERKTVESLLVELVVGKTKFSPEKITMEKQLQRDFNLDSIKSTEIIASIANYFEIQGRIDIRGFENAVLRDIVNAVNTEIEAKEGGGIDTEIQWDSDYFKESWVRNFVIDYIPVELPSQKTKIPIETKVQILHEDCDNDLAMILVEKLQSLGSVVTTSFFTDVVTQELENDSINQLITIVPSSPDGSISGESKIQKLIDRFQAIVRFLPAHDITMSFIQFGGGDFGSKIENPDIQQCCTKAFAASIHLERPEYKVQVIDFSTDISKETIADLVIQESNTTKTYTVAGYKSQLQRLVPIHKVQKAADYLPREITWSGEDVILVTGGAKGITVECALAFAELTGAQMALVGSSEKTNEIHTNIEKFKSKDLSCKYYQCDVGSLDAVMLLTKAIEEDLGPITGVIHGAGRNVPRRAEQVTAVDAFDEISPKLLGAINLCQVLQDSSLKLFVAFSSIIGVTGMPGNAWYGLANEALDLVLRNYHQKYPQVSTQSIAFSLWGEVGMGVRFDIVKNLSSIGVGSIPTKIGTEKFLQLLNNDPGCQHVIVTARLSGMDTWHISGPEQIPQDQRFLQGKIHVESGVEGVVRIQLDHSKDLYLKDHNYNGSYLFPAVFGFEAMAQVAACAIDEHKFSFQRIEDIELKRAIIVPEQGEVVEIHAQVLENDSPQRITVGIRAAQTRFAEDHFSATLVLSPTSISTSQTWEIKEPLAIEPKLDLYGKYLFQGPLFQRLEKIYNLNSRECAFLVEQQELESLGEKSFGIEKMGTFLLGDPFFRDTLLQSLQLIIPRDICLPIYIGSIEIYSQKKMARRLHRGLSILHGKKSPQVYHGEISVVDEDGYLVEKLDDYQLQIIEHHEQNPSVEELVSPDKRDEKLVKNLLNRFSYGLEIPEISLAYISMHTIEIKERHKLQESLFYDSLQKLCEKSKYHSSDYTLSWLKTGKPVVTGHKDNDLGVSLSHGDRICLCVVGHGPQGCDVAPIIQRSHEEWLSLLGQEQDSLILELMKKDNEDVAGTRIWAAQECVRKIQNDSEMTLQVVSRQESSVLFSGQAGDQTFGIITFSVQLLRNPERIFAFAVKTTTAALAVVDTPKTDYSSRLLFRLEDEGQQGQKVIVHRFPLTFKDSSGLSSGIFFTSYLQWMGKVRELAALPIYEKLTRQLESGKWGMVTNYSQINILGEVRPNDLVEARFWIKTVSNNSATIDFCYDWWKVSPDQSSSRIATGEQSVTWVRILDHGVVEMQPLPDYFKEFVDNQRITPEAVGIQTPKAGSLSDIKFGRLLLETTSVLSEKTFETTLENANLVGNIYFSYYFSWQGTVRDLFFQQLAPGYYQGKGESGELLCLFSRVEHSHEAMPFDKILVQMTLQELYENGLSLSFSYFRVNPNGARQRLAEGEHKAVWVVRDKDGNPRVSNLPQEYKEISNKVSISLQADFDS